MNSTGSAKLHQHLADVVESFGVTSRYQRTFELPAKRSIGLLCATAEHSCHRASNTTFSGLLPFRGVKLRLDRRVLELVRGPAFRCTRANSLKYWYQRPSTQVMMRAPGCPGSTEGRSRRRCRSLAQSFPAFFSASSAAASVLACI